MHHQMRKQTIASEGASAPLSLPFFDMGHDPIMLYQLAWLLTKIGQPEQCEQWSLCSP